MSGRPGEAVGTLALGSEGGQGHALDRRSVAKADYTPCQVTFIKHIAPLCPSAISPDRDGRTLPAPPAAPGSAFRGSRLSLFPPPSQPSGEHVFPWTQL